MACVVCKPDDAIQPKFALGTWCSGITPALHVGGPGFNPQCVHDLRRVVHLWPVLLVNLIMSYGLSWRWAHGVVVSHPLRMRGVLGSIPSVSIKHT